MHDIMSKFVKFCLFIIASYCRHIRLRFLYHLSFERKIIKLISQMPCKQDQTLATQYLIWNLRIFF